MLYRRLAFPFTVAAALTLAGGLAATLLLSVAVSRLEFEKSGMVFVQRANLRAAAIGQGLDDAVEVLKVTNHLFSAVSPVTRSQFHAFTTPLLARYPFIQAFNFHRLISDAERAALEAELAQVVPGTVLTEMAEGGKQVAPPRER